MHQRNTRTPLLAGLLAAAIVTSATRGQPLAPFVGPPLMMYAGMYLSSEALQKELKLTAEQVAKVTPLGQDAIRRGFESRGDDKKRAEVNQSLAKELGEVLKPEQMKRLREVIYQQMERIPVGPSVLAGDEEFVKALAITDEQKKRLQGRERLADVLTEEQKSAWKKLQGAPFAEALTFAGGFAPARLVPLALRYLDEKPVQIDLKLSDKQKADFEALFQKWEKDAPARAPRVKGDSKAGPNPTEEYEKAARAVLDAPQRERLEQIILQQNLTNGRESAVFTNERVVKELKLDDKQRERIQAGVEERSRNLLGLFTSDDEVAEIAKRLKEHKKETYQILHALLTPAQQKQLKEIIGEPFKGELTAGLARGRGIGPGASAPPVLTAPIHLVTTGLTNFARSAGLHQELKLTKEQITKLLALQTKARSEMIRRTAAGGDETTIKKRKAQAEAMEKELTTILSPEQTRRFKQVVLQNYTRGARTSFTMLTRIADVQEGLKLTDEQKKKLQGGTEMEKALDAGQLAKWKEMLGEPFKGNLRPAPPFAAGPGGFLGPTSVTLQALQTKAVQDELKLTEKQKKELPELEKKYQEKARRTLGGTFEEFQKARQAAQAELDAACKKLLDANQASRLQEIVLQQAARRGLAALLQEPAVVTGIKLDEKQVQRLGELRRYNTELTRLLSSEFSGAPGGFPGALGQRDDSRGAREAITANYTKKLEQLLSDEQKDMLKRLLGQPFEGRIDTRRGAGGSVP